MASGLPQKIPGHYNAAGEVDRWGSKNEILFLPIVATLLYGLLSVVSFFPSIWNIPVKVTDENRSAVYQCMKDLLIIMKVEVLIVFSFITYFISASKPLPAAFLPVLIIILLGTTGFLIHQTTRIGKEQS